jgi:transposase InsO family protein
MKYRFIMEHRKEFRLGKMCEVLVVSRSGYHNYIRNRTRRKQFEYHKLLAEIKRIYSKSRGTYGSPRIYRELRKMGYLYNRKRVVRIMRENNIKAKTKRKYKVTTNSKHSSPVAENLLGQNFGCTEANRVWVSDITYIWTERGWLYLCCIMDLFSRKIVGWSCDKRIQATLVTSALTEAIAKRGENPGITFHSDRGSQYASYELRALLNDHDMIQSMSGKGNCYDNAVMESFFHTLKTEFVNFEHFKTREEAKMKIFDYIEIFYNRQRSHSTIGYVSPVDFEKQLNHKLVA